MVMADHDQKMIYIDRRVTDRLAPKIGRSGKARPCRNLRPLDAPSPIKALLGH